jgi:hypothetical protein
VRRPGGKHDGVERGRQAGKRGSDAKARRPDDRGPQTYRIVATRQSSQSGDAAVVVDGDATTAWHTDPGARADEAWVRLDLGTRRSIRSVRWLAAADGLAGRMDIALSSDGKRWQTAAGVARETPDGWQERRLKQPVTARYVRVVFTQAADAPRLGGLAELEVTAAATAKDASRTNDQRHAAAGRHHGPPEKKQAQAGPSRQRDNDSKGSKDQPKDQRSNPGMDQTTPQSSRKRGHRRRGS